MLAAALVLGALVLGVRAASAHGRFPQAGSIVIDPSDAGRIWVRTTYGVVTTDDGGGAWRWLCPEGLGFNADNEDPAVVIMADGTAVLGTFDGLSISADRCDFAYAGGALADRFFIDVIPEPGFERALALSSNGIGADTFEVHLWHSDDNAHSWQEIGSAPPPDFLGLSLAVAPSDTDRLYITGRDGAAGDYAGALYRSDDRGQSWTRFDVTGTEDGSALPYVGAVAPDDPDTLYLGIFREEMGAIVYFALVVTRDGGTSWETLFERDDEVTAFAMSPDGSRIAVGGANEGVWVASTSDHVFDQVHPLHARCLTWHETGLYACSDQFADGYNVAVSRDGGATFEPLSQQSSPCGPPEACGQGSSVGDECPARWPTEQVELGAPESCSAGGGGSGGSGGHPAEGGSPSSGSCGCEVLPSPDERHDPAPWWLAIAGLGAAALRRRQPR